MAKAAPKPPVNGVRIVVLPRFWDPPASRDHEGIAGLSAGLFTRTPAR
jgi:hypothetical protein